jgi:hypothetical protein
MVGCRDTPGYGTGAMTAGPNFRERRGRDWFARARR